MDRRPSETTSEAATAEVPDLAQTLPSAGSLLVEKFAPREVAAHRPFRYTVRVTNHSEDPVASAVLVESLISLIRIDDCTPTPQSMEPHSARWVLDPIWPGESRSVVVTATAEQRLWFRSHTAVSYSLGS